MSNERPAILEITEEKIFKTLGRGVPMCTMLNEADANIVKSMIITGQALEHMPKDRTSNIRGMEIIRERQRINLEEIRNIRKDMGCN